MSSTTSDRKTPRGRRRGSALSAFLKPGWFLAAVLIIAFSYFAFTFLAPWQLGKNEAIGERNERIETAFHTDPVPYDEIFDADGAVAEDDEWRRVTVTGHYVPEAETVLRMRPVEGTPSVQVLTPLKMDDGRLVLVNRGWQQARGAEVPDFSAAPDGEVTVTAVARRNEATPDRAPMEGEGHLQVYGIDTGQISQATDVELGRDFVQLSDEDQPGALNPMPIPKLDRGSHLSYGLQWIAFGVMAPAGLGYFIWAELKERRRVDDEESEMADAAGDGPDADGAHGGDGEGRDVGKRTRRGARARFNDMLWDDDDLSEPPADTKTHEHSRSVADRYGGARHDDYAKFARRDEERF